MKAIIVCCFVVLFAACGSVVGPANVIFNPERAATEKLLGVKVNDLPAMKEFDESDPNSPTFKATILLQGSSQADFDPDLGMRSSVYATASDGSVWEAYCGKPGPKQVQFPELGLSSSPAPPPEIVEPYEDFKSTPGNTRQSYDTHLGYAFNPLDIFVGKTKNGRLATTLFFRDVGSHTTAPHHMAIDQSDNIHLVVADVNISDNNSLDLYWVVGSVNGSKWTSAYEIDRRGFTSIAKVWNGAYHDTVHVLWSWDTGQNKSPEMGLYHIEKSLSGFSKKVRIFKGDVWSMSAAIDLKSGRILVAITNNEDCYLISKNPGEKWTRPTPMNKPEFRNAYIQLLPGDSDNFVLSVNNMNSVATWSIQPD